MMPDGMPEGLGDLGSAASGLGKGMLGKMMKERGDREISPSELKESLSAMKELMSNKKISKSDLDHVKKQFQDEFQVDIEAVMKAAEGAGSDELGGEDGKELFKLFNDILKK